MAERAEVDVSDHAARLGIEMDFIGARMDAQLVYDDALAPALRRSLALEQPPSPVEAVERLAALVNDMALMAQASPVIASVGVAIWGRVDPERGEVTDRHFGAAWAHEPFAARLSRALGAPVRLMTGVRAAARAETLVGVGQGRTPLLYVHLGRAVASALVVDGAPVVGAHFDEGRLDHWQTGLETPRCSCGAHGHLGPLVSAQSLIRLAIGVAADDEETLAAIHGVTGGRAEALTVSQLVRLAQRPVRPLRELVDYATEALAGALANLALTLDPAIIVIGGSLAQVDDAFFQWLRERVAMRLTGIGAVPEIARAGVLSHAALIGAAL